MEKYARQAIAEGIKSADDIHIHREAELLRVLNMHYNRSNHLDVSKSLDEINQNRVTIKDKIDLVTFLSL